MSIRTEAEFQAFANLVTAAAVNKRLLMRILAHLEKKDLEVIQEEVGALDADFRKTVMTELSGLMKPPADAAVEEGAVPVGREEERRGHALPNDKRETKDITADAPLGVDHEGRGTERPLSV